MLFFSWGCWAGGIDYKSLKHHIKLAVVVVVGGGGVDECSYWF